MDRLLDGIIAEILATEVVRGESVATDAMSDSGGSVPSGSVGNKKLKLLYWAASSV